MNWKDILEKSVPDGVWVDNTLGVAGTESPIGTPGMPVSNLADARTICAARKTHKLIVCGTFAIDATMNDYKFIGLDKFAVYIDLNSQDCGGSIFRDVTVLGINGSTDLMIFYDCCLGNPTITVFYGQVFNSICMDIEFDDTGTQESVFFNCKSVDALPHTFTVRNHLVKIIGWTGPLTIATVDDAASRVYIWGENSSPVTLAASCIAGQIDVYGDAILTNSSGGSTVNDYTGKQRQVRTIASPVTLTAAVQYIYSDAPGTPFYFAGGFMSRATGAWAGGESITITVDVKIDGTNWINVWTKTIVAEPNPVGLAVPADANSALLNIPKGFSNNGGGVRVGVVQTV